ncbi:MAG: squalene/phytoene synthase family protein [Pseudomonadota bacterium]
MSDNHAHFVLDANAGTACREILKQSGGDMYFATMFLPPQARDLANVLFAFDAQIRSIPHLVAEPMAGEVRVQWWTDVVMRERDGEAAGHPLARALVQLLDFDPSLAPTLTAKLQAHIFDFYSDPMEDRAMLEGWCGETLSVLLHRTALACGAEADTRLADLSGHAGCAVAMTRLLETIAFQRSRNQCYFPMDLLSAVGLSATEFMEPPDERHRIALSGMVDLAAEHLNRANEAQMISAIEPAKAAFRVLAATRMRHKRIKKQLMKDWQRLFAGMPPPSQLRVQWALLRG